MSAADRIVPSSPHLSERHEALRRRVRNFALAEIAPHASQWDEAGAFPRRLFVDAARAGVLGAGFPEQYGGLGGDIFDKLIVKEELTRFGCGGVRAALTSLGIGLPPILAYGGATLCERVGPAVLSGEKILALAVTEPHGGSDVAGLRTTARRDGDAYVVDGEKVLITSGVQADYYTVAVRTGGAGRAGLSLLLVEKGAEGFTQERIPTMGWWSSDTGRLLFKGVRVAATNIIGPENDGFRVMMHNFNEERLGNIAIMLGASKACYDASVEHVAKREVFGRPLVSNQVVRHKLVDMATKIQTVELSLHALAERFRAGEQPGAHIAMLKNSASEANEFCASEAVQMHGGAGIARSGPVERLFRESKILSIGGGSVEVLKDFVARQFGYETAP